MSSRTTSAAHRHLEIGIAFDQMVADGRARLDAAVRRVRDRAPAGLPVGELVRGGVIAGWWTVASWLSSSSSSTATSGNGIDSRPGP